MKEGTTGMESETGTRPIAGPDLPRRVVIMGDADAWLAALMLRNLLPQDLVRLTVCSAGGDNGQRLPAFVSTPSLTRTLLQLGLDEYDLLRESAGTYRLGTLYSDWSHEGRDFWVPLGMEQLSWAAEPLFYLWLSERKAGRLLRPFHAWSPNWAAALAGKAPHSFSGDAPLGAARVYGFHGDSGRLFSWLKSQAISRGVEEVAGEILRRFPDGGGGIAQIEVAGHGIVKGDLYLNCIASDDDSCWNEWPWAAARFAVQRVSHQAAVPPFDRLTGTEYGWKKTVPLVDQTENLYAFHAAAADDAFMQKVIGESLVPSVLDHHSGCRKQFWEGNQIHIGPAAARIGLLSDQQLHVLQAQVEILLELFPDRRGGRAVAREYNSRVSTMLASIRSELAVHELQLRSTARSGEQQRQLEKESAELLDLYDAVGIVEQTSMFAPAAVNLQAFLAGSGRLPRAATLLRNDPGPEAVQSMLRNLTARNEEITRDLARHEDLLEWIHAGPLR